ncbi:undecaprenyl diphosphate synthase family protein [Streptomyces blattellae]|uniref:undecaprenyl diphosphate synthase family protein n=1 Tax=Streptomyces blattellae TaxID=2569855 RepID=UPI0012B947D0|nr:undecaprenyl diphosphate synthase family protein [Streptomyces blattellae]
MRTSGERRLSGFLLCQACDATLHFDDRWWPDHDRTALAEALAVRHLVASRLHRAATPWCRSGPISVNARPLNAAAALVAAYAAVRPGLNRYETTTNVPAQQKAPDLQVSWSGALSGRRVGLYAGYI